MTNRHSGESRNLENSKHWAPAFAGATNKTALPWGRKMVRHCIFNIEKTKEKYFG